MAKNLLIVESPAKAKTIEKYLGKDFKVKSSYGHIRDLDKGSKGIDIENDFKPSYVVSPEKTKVVKELKEWVKKVDEVWLATDEDREGEAISWHLCEVLGLNEATTKRIVFREITKPAITKAINNPRKVDANLVNAQQARRILDRLVGFELSETLWRKVRNKLSAGRVQSVAVKILVDREREINNFESKTFYSLQAHFIVKDEQGRETTLEADYPNKFESEKDLMHFLNGCLEAEFSIADIEKKPAKRRPAPPFITSTLQQEASRKLGFAVRRTMQIAQRLYERGLITYMRTDSVNMSEVAQQAIEALIRSDYGDRYHFARRFKSKSGNAQEAHEAIRPTYFENKSIEGDRDEVRLYELIWKRAVASQMADAELEKTLVNIAISNLPEEKLIATGEVMIFDGFLKLYQVSKDEDSDEDTKGILPPLQLNQLLPLKVMEAREKFTKPPARYTEASLVKKLEEKGIGRPSTYAPTITKIMEPGRGYVVKESREGEERTYKKFILENNQIVKSTEEERFGVVKNRLFPTDIGMIVTDFLSEHFPTIMDYSFTADIEEDFDEIADGKTEWKKMVSEFYKPFHNQIEKTIAESDRATGERILGKHPENGKTVLVRMARYGPVVQLGTTEEVGEEHTDQIQYGSLKPEQSLEMITFEDALESLKLPKVIGEFEGKEVLVNNGRYGPYIKYDETFINIGRNTDPLKLELEDAIEFILEKRKADAPVMQYKGLPVTRGKGRFGPYLKYDGMFVNIPRRYDPENLTKDEMIELIDKKIEKEANRYIHKWDDLNLAVENGRWGPFIRFKKKSIKLPKSEDGKRMTSEEAAELTLEEVKALVEAEIPKAFPKKKAKAAPKKKKSEATSEKE